MNEAAQQFRKNCIPSDNVPGMVFVVSRCFTEAISVGALKRRREQSAVFSISAFRVRVHSLLSKFGRLEINAEKHLLLLCIVSSKFSCCFF